MKSFCVCAGLMALAFATQARSTSWTRLFDGQSLNGWRVECRPEDAGKKFFRVEDGAIVVDSRGRKDHDYVWLVSDAEFSDFELQMSVRADGSFPGNSGLQIRSRYDGDAHWMNGPQVDIHPPAPWRTGLIYDETREVRRWIFPSLKDWNIKESEGPKKWRWHAGGWNRIRVICRGGRITTEVNGIRIADYDGAGVLDDEAHTRHGVGLRGHVALQLHARDEVYLSVRDLRIATLGT